MAITRTPIVDDDGTGTSGTVINNSWKQEFYNQIDGALGGTGMSGILGSWSDASGAGLTLSGSGWYVQLGKIIFIFAQVTWPATSNANPASLGYLPFPCGTYAGGLYQAAGTGKHWYIGPSTQVMQPINPAGGGGMTNAQMSGAYNTMVGMYLIA